MSVNGPDLHDLYLAHRRIDELQRTVSSNRELWLVVIWTVVACLIVYFVYRQPEKEFWEGANRCQTLWLMDRAARANLSDEDEVKTKIAAKSVSEALSQCSEADLRGDGEGDE